MRLEGIPRGFLQPPAPSLARRAVTERTAEEEAIMAAGIAWLCGHSTSQGLDATRRSERQIDCGRGAWTYDRTPKSRNRFVVWPMSMS